MKVDYEHEKPILEMKGIKKEFSGVYALSGITFDLYRGEVHCLVGENGAGKSTLMKILSGAYQPSEGVIVFNGKEYDTLTPKLSKELGINIVYQENDLVPSMNVIENIYIGNELSKGTGFVDFKAMREATVRQINDLDIDIDPNTLIKNLSVSDQQYVKILKALSVEPKVLIMDEPTSMFNVEDAAKVLTLIKKISERGIGVIFISHFLREVQSTADRVTIIRDGSVVNTYTNGKKDLKISTITKDMVGRPIDTFFKKERCPIGEVVLEVRNLQLTKRSPKISFELHKGEILGFSGMVGAGRTEIVRAITGADSKYAGEIYLHGRKINIKNPSDSIDHGFAHITEDRQQQGLMLNNSVVENTTIVGIRNKIKGLFVNIKKEPPLIAPILKELEVKTPSVWTKAIYLSGGNQQKVVLAKWLFVEQEIYVFDEPTRGIDVNAKAEFYKQMSKLTAEGKSIIMISSDMPELISMSDRVLVVRDGVIDCELTGDEINEQEIIRRALGVKKHE